MKKTKNKAFADQRSLFERRHAKAVETHQRAEAALARALLKWHRSLKTLQRYDKRADKLLAEYDWRDLAQSASQIKAKEQD